MKTYIYPENLKQKAKLWLWELKDIVIIGTGIILAVYLLAETSILIPFCIVGVYAFMSMRIDEVSLLDYLKYSVRFLISSQQTFYWRLDNDKK